MSASTRPVVAICIDQSLPPLAGGWPLTQPNYHFSLGGKSCTLAPLNIIPKFPKEKHKFLSDFPQNPARLCVSYVWLLMDTKCFLENFVIKKMAYMMNRLQKDERWQRLLLGDCSGGWRPLYAGRWADTSNFVKHILFFKWQLIPRSGHNISHYKTAKLMIHVQKYNRLISDE